MKVNKFLIYQNLRKQIPKCKLKLFIRKVYSSIPIEEYQIDGLFAEWRAFNYLKNWRSKWSFVISETKDDILGIDIIGTKPDGTKAKFQVTTDRSKINRDTSNPFDYAVIVEKKIFIWKMIK